jgi:hypothetical protein
MRKNIEKQGGAGMLLRRGILCVLFALSGVTLFAADKTVYVPSSMSGSNLNSESSQWCYARSRQSTDFIVFWEAGYTNNPDTVKVGNYTVNVDKLLKFAESCYRYYVDSLKFVVPGASKTDKYKMVIRLYCTSSWTASGSGEDNVIGTLNLSAWAASAGGAVVAHEVGHCFQYQVHCDGFPGGWMYGLGDNGAGGNGWWEQCANWMAYSFYPNEKFVNAYNYLATYLQYCHKNILHETPRYANYFIQDYWTYLHGIDFIAKMWQQSKYPEDPVDAYKRLNGGMSEAAFNDEIYDCAARFVTWNIPSLRARGANYISARGQCKLNKQSDGYWRIDSTQCIENYGYNALQLNVPAEGKTLTAYFQGLKNAPGFRHINANLAGWRYGFVALMKDGSRVYSPFGRPVYGTPDDTLRWDCPSGCERLWLVVSGAPRLHFHHQWDDNAANDEQWPYQVKFSGTNILGNFDFEDGDVAHNDTLRYEVNETPFVQSGTGGSYPSTAVAVDVSRVCSALHMQLSEYQTAYGNTVKYAAVQPNGTLNYSSTANAPGHWFNGSGYVTNWGSSSYVFSEFKPSSLVFNIGQYPNLCKVGNHYTIRQALVYTPTSGAQVKVLFVFHINIVSATGISTPTTNVDAGKTAVLRNLNGQTLRTAPSREALSVEGLPHGIYLITIGRTTHKIAL